MNQTEWSVRIVVAQPTAPVVSRAPVSDADLVAVLRGLGNAVEVAAVSNADACIAACASEPVDLVVIDHALGDQCALILTALRVEGFPLVVAMRHASDRAALELFRSGASDCVTLGSDAAATLPSVAREQIRRYRAALARSASAHHAADIEKNTENIIENMNSALLVVDMDGRITFCNPPAGRILGEDPKALRGRAVWAWFSSDEQEASLLARTLSTGVSYKGAERVVLRSDGTPVPVGISCSPFFDSEGEKIGAVAIFQDLTEAKEVQSQVLQTEKMASIGQLAAGVAHEINNPMGFIHANLFQMAEYLTDIRRVWDRVEELLQRTRGGDLAKIEAAGLAVEQAAREVDLAFVISDLGKAIRESQEGSERIRHIVQDLRDFSHHDSSERVLADVNQCLDSTATIVWPMMKQIVVLEKHYEELGAISCYPMQIKQVFMNLLVNAYQSIESKVGEGGETGKVWLRTRQRDDGVVVEVTDTGIGIPASHVDRIFDPFFTTKKVGSGTGLGLSTSFGIVQRHGGSLTVDSKEGEGTTFRVFLPIESDSGLDDGA